MHDRQDIAEEIKRLRLAVHEALAQQAVLPGDLVADVVLEAVRVSDAVCRVERDQLLGD
jgi:hypothetical protein